MVEVSWVFGKTCLSFSEDRDYRLHSSIRLGNGESTLSGLNIYSGNAPGRKRYGSATRKVKKDFICA
jgi:hypothetical protein